MTPVDTDPTDLGPDSDHLETARTDPAPPPIPGPPSTDEQLRLEYLRRAVDADEERIRQTIPDCPASDRR